MVTADSVTPKPPRTGQRGSLSGQVHFPSTPAGRVRPVGGDVCSGFLHQEERRSKAGRLTWEQFNRLHKRHPLQPARVVHSIYAT